MRSALEIISKQTLVPFQERKLTVPTEALPWPENRDQVVAVNSFGIGGSNAHVCDSQAPYENLQEGTNVCSH